MSDGTPTWQLVLTAAARLAAAGDRSFRLGEIVAEVQRGDPARGRGTIQPVVQGMTANAGTGPPSPCGKPLLRVGHGLYRLADDADGSAAGPPGWRHSRCFGSGCATALASWPHWSCCAWMIRSWTRPVPPPLCGPSSSALKW